MKKYFLTLISVLSIVSFSNAQTKTAYCDLYVRGGGQHQRTTIMYNGTPLKIGKANTAQMLNALSTLGWELQNDISGSIIEVKRFFGWPMTRHKYHIILNKTYAANEDPYQGLNEIIKKQTEHLKQVNKKPKVSKKNNERKYPEWGTR